MNLVEESEGHGVAVELGFVGGDCGEDHADGSDNGDREDSDDCGEPTGKDGTEARVSAQRKSEIWKLTASRP